MKRGILVLALALLIAIPIAWMDTTTHAQIGDNGRPFRCTVEVSTATAVTAVGGDCAAQADGRSIWITDIAASSSAAAGTAADSMNTLKFGSGSNCGTGTTVVWAPLYVANSTVVGDFTTPIIIPAGKDLCWINSTAGTKTWLISGYIRN